MEELVTRLTPKRSRLLDPERLKSDQPVSSSSPYWRS
jgi:hypothetical protein